MHKNLVVFVLAILGITSIAWAQDPKRSDWSETVNVTAPGLDDHGTFICGNSEQYLWDCVDETRANPFRNETDQRLAGPYFGRGAATTLEAPPQESNTIRFGRTPWQSTGTTWAGAPPRRSHPETAHPAPSLRTQAENAAAQVAPSYVYLEPGDCLSIGPRPRSRKWKLLSIGAIAGSVPLMWRHCVDAACTDRADPSPARGWTGAAMLATALLGLIPDTGRQVCAKSGGYWVTLPPYAERPSGKNR